ncbi:MAG: sensor histidine kinase [Candidatus Acidiferrum sp.]
MTDITVWKLPVRLASLIFALVMIIAIGVTAFFTEAGVTNSRSWVLHTYDVKSHLSDLQSSLNEMRASAAFYFLSNDNAELASFQDQASHIQNITDALQRLTTDNPRQQERLSQLRPLTAGQVAQMKAFAGGQKRIAMGDPELRNSVDQAAAHANQIASIIATMQSEEDSLLQRRLKTWDSLFKRNILILAAAFALAIVLLVYNFRFLNAEIARGKQAERLEKQNTDSYRVLSARILELQDVERRKIARELHDSVGQYLAGLKLNLQQLRSAMPSSTPETSALILETIDLTDRAIGEVRTMSHLLHPPLLDELGLDSAVRWYVEGFSKRSGIEVKLKIGDIAERLPREIELALFRVLQESLTNVHRHSQASLVDIDLRCADGKAILIVHDNGKGISQAILLRFRAGLAGGIGLAGMRERLAELRGNLEVESSSRGCVVRAALPVNTCDSKDAEPANAIERLN